MPASRKLIERKKKENLILIRPVSRKYYPVDYRDIEEPVWYNVAYTNYMYAKACIDYQFPPEVSKYIKIHRGRYIKEKDIKRATSPFRRRLVLKYIYNLEHIANEKRAFKLRKTKREQEYKKKHGILRKISPNHPRYDQWMRRKAKFEAQKKGKKKTKK